MVYITYPGPVAVTDTNGEPLHFVGEMTFKVIIEGQSTNMSAWVTNNIEPGQLIMDSDIPEDLGLQLYNISDVLSPSGHAEDTDTIKDPRGSSPVTRTSKLRVPARDVSHSNDHPSNAFLAPFRHGFHREIVRSANGKTLTIYYLTEDGVRLRSKKELGPHIKHLQGITKDNFNFLPVELPIADPTNKYQSTRSSNATRRSIPRVVLREPYQSTDDSAHSAEEARRHQKTDQHWEQDTCWGQPEDVYIKQEFDPGPYNTEVIRHKDKDWRSKKPIPSSNETEEEAHYETRHITQDSIESRKLADTKVRNRILLSNMNREDIKQEPNNYIKQEPDNYTQPPQKTQHQREPPQREPQQRVETQWSNAHDHTTTPPSRPNSSRQVSIPSQFNAHHQQPSTHHHKREMPREYSDWN